MTDAPKPSAITPELAAKCSLLDIKIDYGGKSTRAFPKYAIWRPGPIHDVWCRSDAAQWQEYPVFDTPEEALAFYIEGNGKWM